MSDTVYFGNYVVEHENAFTSTVYHEGWAVRVFHGSETSWMDAERYASDMMFMDIYG